MKKVLLLLAEGFEIYEASVFIDVVGWNLMDGDGSVSLSTCGLRKNLNSTFNLKVETDLLVSELVVDDFDALAIPGGFESYKFYDDAFNETFLNVIRTFHRKGKLIASICTGALPIGKSGILKGKCATTYNKSNGQRLQMLREMDVNVLLLPIVVDDNIITSWNPSTALDVAYLLLERLTSVENCNVVKDCMGVTST